MPAWGSASPWRHARYPPAPVVDPHQIASCPCRSFIPYRAPLRPGDPFLLHRRRWQFCRPGSIAAFTVDQGVCRHSSVECSQLRPVRLFRDASRRQLRFAARRNNRKACRMRRVWLRSHDNPLDARRQMAAVQSGCHGQACSTAQGYIKCGTFVGIAVLCHVAQRLRFPRAARPLGDATSLPMTFPL